MSEPTKILSPLEQENELLKETLKYLTRPGGILRELSSTVSNGNLETSATLLSSYSNAAKTELDMARQRLSEIKINIDDVCDGDHKYFKEHLPIIPLCSEEQLKDIRKSTENSDNDQENDKAKIQSGEVSPQNEGIAVKDVTTDINEQTEYPLDTSFEPYENIDGFIESVLAKINAAKKNILELGNVDPFASSSDDIRRQEETLARLFADTESSDDEDAQTQTDSVKVVAPTL